MTGVLYLIPTPLGEHGGAASLPAAVQARVRSLHYFIVEQAKTARAFLKAAAHPDVIASLRLEAMSAHMPREQIDALLDPVAAGLDAGLLAEAGAPGVADPGAVLVQRAHERNIRVVPLVGPSAILLALMASGLEGQRFAFHGYLPVPEAELVERIKAIEVQSRQWRQTQIFIETPYRNDRLLRILLAHARARTLLCVATQLTQADEQVRTDAIGGWRERPAVIGKRPSVFLLLASQEKG